MLRGVVKGLLLAIVFLAGCRLISPTEKVQKNCIYLNMSADAIPIQAKFAKEGKGVSKEEAINRCTKAEIIEALNGFVDYYADTQVKGLFLNVNYQRACFDSEVMEAYWDQENPEKDLVGWTRMFLALKKKDVDAFDVCVKRCRENKIEPWISFRMNDHHYFDKPALINSFYLDNPEFRTRPPHGLFNYGKKEVRDYYKAFIVETLDKYDVDGIELDWMRTQHLFPDGKAAEGMKLIDQFMREIREITKAKAKERGHPIKVAVRIPVTPEIGKQFGLDGVTWAREGLVDLLVLSNWFVPTDFDIPVERWKKEIGPESSAIIAAGVDFAYCICHKEQVKQLKGNIETMRGFAASSYSRGADAIYIFNSFMIPFKMKIIGADGKVSYSNDKKQAMNEIGQLSTALGKSRTHVFTYHDPDVEKRPREPIALKSGETKEFEIHIGPKPETGDSFVNVGLESKTGFEKADIFVTVNGSPCQILGDMLCDPKYKYDNTRVWHVVQHVSETGARVMQFKVNPGALKDGYNLISITNKSKDGQALTWLEMHLD
ncbi:MAG: hypothetical protein PF904_11920 [Kiritimatiellae bacterium]|jgi:hypothetical protein|nr:hypothetical protein [Kiritimatiellia bacterium]